MFLRVKKREKDQEPERQKERFMEWWALVECGEKLCFTVPEKVALFKIWSGSLWQGPAHRKTFRRLLGTGHSEHIRKVASHPEAPSRLPVLCVPSCSLSSEVEVTVCHPTAIPLQLWACGSVLRLAFIPHRLTALPLCLQLRRSSALVDTLC